MISSFDDKHNEKRCIYIPLAMTWMALKFTKDINIAMT